MLGWWGTYSRYRVGVRDNSGQISLGFGVGIGGKWWDWGGAGDSGWFGFGDTGDRTWECFYRLKVMRGGLKNYNFPLLFLSLWGGFGSFAGRGEARRFDCGFFFKKMGLILFFRRYFNDWFTGPNDNDFMLGWDLGHNFTLRLVSHAHIRHVIEGDGTSVLVPIIEQTLLV